MALTVRQLLINVTASNTWTQLTEGGVAYAVPTGGHSDIKLLSANNLGANAANVCFAVSDNGTIADGEIIWPNPLLTTGEYAEDDGVRVMREGQGLWARAVGTTPNVTFNASILENA